MHRIRTLTAALLLFAAGLRRGRGRACARRESRAGTGSGRGRGPESAGHHECEGSAARRRLRYSVTIACRIGRKAIVQLLLDKGADVNAEFGRPLTCTRFESGPFCSATFPFFIARPSYQNPQRLTTHLIRHPAGSNTATWRVKITT